MASVIRKFYIDRIEEIFPQKKYLLSKKKKIDGINTDILKKSGEKITIWSVESFSYIHYFHG